MSAQDFRPIERALAEFFEQQAFVPAQSRGDLFIGVAQCHATDDGNKARLWVEGEPKCAIVSISELARHLAEAGVV